MGNRTEVLSFRATPAEREKLQALAARHEITVASLIRSLALFAVGQEISSTPQSSIAAPEWSGTPAALPLGNANVDSSAGESASA